MVDYAPQNIAQSQQPNEQKKLSEIVREARELKRADMIVSKIDILARSDDMSVTLTFIPTRDIDRKGAVAWLRRFTLELQEAGFQPKDTPYVPRGGLSAGGGYKPKADKVQWLKLDGTPLICGCGQGTYRAGTGNVTCMDRSANKDYRGKHAFIPKERIESGE